MSKCHETEPEPNIKYRNCRTIADIKKDPRVKEGPWREETGWWVHLVTGGTEHEGNLWGFFQDEVSLIHEPTIRDILRILNNETHLHSQKLGNYCW